MLPLLLIFLTAASPGCRKRLPAQNAASATPSRYAGTYEYVYPYNTETLVENHYIVLEETNGVLQGWYYGTSDDFDPAREGYPPGFFVAGMRDLEIKGNTIRFSLQVAADDYFTAPVPLDCRATREVPAGRLGKWDYGASAEAHAYQGAIAEDRIVLNMDDTKRVFGKRASP